MGPPPLEPPTGGRAALVVPITLALWVAVVGAAYLAIWLAPRHG